MKFDVIKSTIKVESSMKPAKGTIIPLGQTSQTLCPHHVSSKTHTEYNQDFRASWDLLNDGEMLIAPNGGHPPLKKLEERECWEVQ